MAVGPARVRPPGRAFEHEAEPALARQRDVRLVVAAQPLGPLLVLEQVEGGEFGQVEPLVEDQDGLDPTVGEKEVAAELG